ncbi:Trypsin-like peptidase domain-containing protein [Lentzea albidocapillata subsp. violacea]|uniref:Trypsin-like peptidase domain-containing protein n=1 Tax=Lentzea albidocapillata subsp. violacea TaxID=128104 RepID=A0A1G9BN22_9PSEU|nr:serine protease [Lentzea albidocapillata]SDK40265.1 Trypsin-like peptidase domain-containing protein [Lentzea albidocapillata subsp. violacea]
MARRFAGTLLAAIAALGVTTAPAQASVDFTGTVKLNNCSGSVVRMPSSAPADKALVLTNGHCVELMKPGQVLVGQPVDRTFKLLGGSGAEIATLHSAKLVYATMTGTDAALYQLDKTYQQIQQQHGGRALELSASRPVAKSEIRIVSGYWTKIYSCQLDGFVHQVKEASWTWHDSLRYTPSCDTIGGTSGSPIIDDASGKVVGVNNTGNESGGRCTMNNPCEVDAAGKITVRRGTNYGQQTFGFVSCFGPRTTLDLTLPGCRIAKPQP